MPPITSMAPNLPPFAPLCMIRYFSDNYNLICLVEVCCSNVLGTVQGMDICLFVLFAAYFYHSSLDIWIWKATHPPGQHFLGLNKCLGYKVWGTKFGVQSLGCWNIWGGNTFGAQKYFGVDKIWMKLCVGYFFACFTFFGANVFRWSKNCAQNFSWSKFWGCKYFGGHTNLWIPFLGC